MIVDMPLESATPDSYWQEALDDEAGWAMAILGIWHQSLRFAY